MSPSVARIEELLAALEREAPPAVVDRVRELLAAVLELHGAGLSRALELCAEHPDLVEALGRDTAVRSLLVLHDLHPESPLARLEEALASAEPRLREMGARAELEPETPRLHLHHDGSADARAAIERIVDEAAPDLDGLIVEEEVRPSADVPLERLTGRKELR